MSPNSETHMFLLSAEDIEMSSEEVRSVAQLDTAKMKLDAQILVAERNLELKQEPQHSRLALTRMICKHLFSCRRKELESKMLEFDWSKIYDTNFRIKVRRAGNVSKLHISEKDLSEYIWNVITNPKVQIDNSKTPIEFWITEETVHCGILIHNNKEKFEERKSHKRPFNIPTTLDPKLARACVNLTEVQTGQTVFDPFCGAGGILLEAGLMGFKVVGNDIDNYVLQKCKQNLEHYGITEFKLQTKDATAIEIDMDVVVTDVPYGKSSILQTSREELYESFLKNLYNHLKGKAIVIFPDKVDYVNLIKQTDFEIENEFSVYIHKSLTRKIVKLKKK